MRFPYRSIQTIFAIARKILPCPFKGKNLTRVMGEMLCLGLTLGKGKPISCHLLL